MVTKVEPPNWWIKLTPEVVLLLSGQNLEATHVECNLSSLIVGRTQSTAGGKYLFVWLRIAADTKSGTAVCRITTNAGQTSFELPLAARQAAIGRFQGLARNDVLYRIVPDRFANGDPTNDDLAEAQTPDRSNPRATHGGDLRGISEHLAYLKDLGVTTLSLTAIVKYGAISDDHVSAIVDLYAVDPRLGTLQDYRELVAAAHQQHMKVFFAIDPNQVSPRHAWVANPPLPDWFHGTPQRHANSSATITDSPYGQANDASITRAPFETIVDPHAPPRMWRALTDGWSSGTAPDLNTENPFVLQYFLQNAIWWAESSGLDGYRIDGFPYIPRQFWANWHAGLRKLYPRLTTVGEVAHPDPSVTSLFVGGKRTDGIDSGLTTVLDFPMYFTLRDVLLRAAPVGRIADVLRHDALFAHADDLVTFFSNQGMPRFAAAQGSSLAKLKLAFGLALTLRGIPELYYGDEISMSGAAEPGLLQDFPGGRPDNSHNAIAPEQQEIFAHVQGLLRLRRAHAALSEGHLWHLSSDNSSYVFVRETEEERMLVAFNNAPQPRDLRVSLSDTPVQDAAGIAPVFGGATATLSGKEIHLKMPPQSLSIFVLN